MKIVISHDVDHLYPSDHRKDLIFPKLWIRSSLDLIKGNINFKIWISRLFSIFSKKLHMIPELTKFEKENNIPSAFFFGMDNILGLSYDKKAALPWIKYLMDNGFDVGVHGIDFLDLQKILTEKHEFEILSGLDTFGIRMHYVRFNENTFSHLASAGYLFDSTYFNKNEIEIVPPYKVGQMWEFPLYIMDAYVLSNGLLNGKEITLKVIDKANDLNMPYFTILFHDYMFNERTHPDYIEWYKWLIQYLKSKNFVFISYRDAIKELEKQI